MGSESGSGGREEAEAVVGVGWSGCHARSQPVGRHAHPGARESGCHTHGGLEAQPLGRDADAGPRIGRGCNAGRRLHSGRDAGRHDVGCDSEARRYGHAHPQEAAVPLGRDARHHGQRHSSAGDHSLHVHPGRDADRGRGAGHSDARPDRASRAHDARAVQYAAVGERHRGAEPASAGRGAGGHVSDGGIQDSGSSRVVCAHPDSRSEAPGHTDPDGRHSAVRHSRGGSHAAIRRPEGGRRGIAVPEARGLSVLRRAVERERGGGDDRGGEQGAQDHEAAAEGEEWDPSSAEDVAAAADGQSAGVWCGASVHPDSASAHVSHPGGPGAASAGEGDRQGAVQAGRAGEAFRAQDSGGDRAPSDRRRLLRPCGGPGDHL